MVKNNASQVLKAGFGEWIEGRIAGRIVDRSGMQDFWQESRQDWLLNLLNGN